MAAPLTTNSSDNKPWKSSPTPKLTVPQLLAFAAFVILALMTLVKHSAVGPSEYDGLKRLCIFLIAALLPSDALIRFGRSRLMAATEDTESAASFPSQMQSTTLGQLLGFATFVVMCLVAIFGSYSHGHFAQLAEVASILIAALLPSEAVTRFGRALWLARTPAAKITNEALTRI